MSKKRIGLLVLVISALVLAACAPAAPPPAAPTAAPAAPTAAPATPTTAPAAAAPVTITVWDYYGEATPIKPLIEPFEKANPGIKIQYEALDWNTTQEKLNVVLTGGTPTMGVGSSVPWRSTRMRPGRSVMSMLPSGRKTRLQGCDRPRATTVTRIFGTSAVSNTNGPAPSGGTRMPTVACRA